MAQQCTEVNSMSLAFRTTNKKETRMSINMRSAAAALVSFVGSVWAVTLNIMIALNSSY